MTLLDSLIKPTHRRILTVTLCAVAGALSACGPAVTTGPEQAPGSQQALPFDPREVVQSMGTASTRAQISPELRVHPSETFDSQAASTAVAAGNGLYLVVWADYTSSRYPDILGARVRSSDGALLDPSPIPIATGQNVQYRPAVAFDGTNFLVTWDEIQSAPPSTVPG